jgi:hypothetical protein
LKSLRIVRPTPPTRGFVFDFPAPDHDPDHNLAGHASYRDQEHDQDHEQESNTGGFFLFTAKRGR